MSRRRAGCGGARGGDLPTDDGGLLPVDAPPVTDTQTPDDRDSPAVRGNSSNTAFVHCAMIDGTRATVLPYASGLAPGVCTVCARGFRDDTTVTPAIPDYVLSVSTSP